MNTTQPGKALKSRPQSAHPAPRNQANAGFIIPTEIRDTTPRRRADWLIDTTVENITLAGEKKISAALRLSLQEIRQQHRTLETFKETHQPIVDQLKTLLSESEQRNIAANAESSRLQAKLTKEKEQWLKETADLKRQLEEKDQTITRLDAELPSIKDKNKQLEDNNSALTEDIGKLRERKKQLKASLNENMYNKNQVQMLKTALNDQSNELDLLKGIDEESKECRRMLQESNTTIEELQKTNAELQQTNVDLQSQLEISQTSLGVCESAMERYLKLLNERKTDLNAKITEFSSGFATLQKATISVKQKLKDAVALQHAAECIQTCTNALKHVGLDDKEFEKTYDAFNKRTQKLKIIINKLKAQKVQTNSAKTAKWTEEYLKLKNEFQNWDGHQKTNPAGIQLHIDEAHNFKNHFATLEACTEYVDIEEDHIKGLALCLKKAKDFFTDLQAKRNAQIEEETKKRNESLIKLEKEASTSQVEILRVRDDFKSRAEEAAKDSNRCQEELTEKKEQLTALHDIAINKLQPLFEAAREHIKEDKTVEIVENVENSIQMTWKKAVSIMNNMRSVECTASIFAASFTAAGSDESAATFTTLSKEAKDIKDILEKDLNNADVSPSQQIKRLSAENGRLESFKTEVITLFKELDKKLNEFMQNTTHDSSICITEHNIKQYMNRMKEIQSVALSSERLTYMRQFIFRFSRDAVKFDYVQKATRTAGLIQSRINDYMSKQAKKLKELQAQVDDATRAKEQIQAQLSEARARCNDAENRERSSKQNLTSVEGELAALRQKEEAKQAALRATFEDETKRLQARLEAAETAFQDGEQKHKQLKDEYAEMKQRSNEAVALAAVNAATKDKLKQVEAQLLTAQSEALNHKGATDQLKNANASLKQSKDAKIEELQAAFEVTKTRIQAELTSVQAKLAALKHHEKAQSEALGKAAKDKKELEAKLKAAETACQAENDSLKVANAVLQRRKEDLKLRLKDVEAELAKLKQQKDDKIKTLQATFKGEKERIEAESSDAQNKAISLDVELKQLQGKHEELRKQYKAGTTKLTSAEEELATLRKLKEEKIVKNESQAESKLAEMTTRIEGLKSVQSKQKAIIDGNAKLIADRESQLRTEFDEIQQELIDKHKAQLLELNTEHESERRDDSEEIEKLQVTNHDLIETLDEQLKELEKCTRDSRRQERELGSVNREKEALEKSQALVLEEKQKEIKQLHSQEQAAQKSIRQLTLQLQENEKKLAKERNSQQAELEHFKQHTLASADKIVDDQKKKHAKILKKLEDDLSTAESLKRTLVTEKELLQAKNKKDTATIQILEKEILEKRGQFITMSSTLQQNKETHRSELSKQKDQMQKRQDSLHSQMQSEKEDMRRRHESQLAQQTRDLQKKIESLRAELEKCKAELAQSEQVAKTTEKPKKVEQPVKIQEKSKRASSWLPVKGPRKEVRELQGLW